jgi:bacterioferritin (cytochrome b1)
MEGEEEEVAEGDAMQLARLLCDRIQNAGDAPNAQIMASLRMDLERLRVLVQAQVRQSTFQQMRHRVERDILVCESQSDQVDREANSARIADRQRFLFERQQAQSGQAAAAERAAASAAYVESALCSLCPYVTQTSSGSAQLAK